MLFRVLIGLSEFRSCTLCYAKMSALGIHTLAVVPNTLLQKADKGLAPSNSFSLEVALAGQIRVITSPCSAPSILRSR